MPSKVTKPQKPEDMLLRVIRVAEILVKSQRQSAEEAAVHCPIKRLRLQFGCKKHSHSILV